MAAKTPKRGGTRSYVALSRIDGYPPGGRTEYGEVIEGDPDTDAALRELVQGGTLVPREGAKGEAAELWVATDHREATRLEALHEVALAADTSQVYAKRDRVNLFELACLLHGADPELVAQRAYDDIQQHRRAVGGQFDPVFPSQALAEVDARPKTILGDTIGGTLAKLMRATDTRTAQHSVFLPAARRLAEALGFDLPDMRGQGRETVRALPDKLLPRSGLAYWRQALAAHISSIDAACGGQATATQAIAYLKNLKDPRIPVGGAVDTLVWLTDHGGKKPVSKKTVANALAVARRGANEAAIHPALIPNFPP